MNLPQGGTHVRPRLWLLTDERDGIKSLSLSHFRPFFGTAPAARRFGASSGRSLFLAGFFAAAFATPLRAGAWPRAEDETYAKLSPAVLLVLARGFSVEVGYDRAIDGGNTLAGRGFSAGLAWQGKL